MVKNVIVNMALFKTVSYLIYIYLCSFQVYLSIIFVFMFLEQKKDQTRTIYEQRPYRHRRKVKYMAGVLFYSNFLGGPVSWLIFDCDLSI